MIKIYSMSVEVLYEETIFKAACDKLDTSRLEKVNGAKRTEDKILRVGAGLLLQYAVKESSVFDSKQDVASDGEMLQHDSRVLCCSEVSVSQVLSGIREPIEFEFRYGPHGKPYFKEDYRKEKGGLFFSLSHSGDFVLCAISDEEIGVDIQMIPEAEQKRVDREMKIADKFFTKQERIWYQQEVMLPQSEEEIKRTRFYRIWAAKEAYMKWTGNGLTEGLSTFEVNLESGTVAGAVSDDVKACIFEIDVPGGYVACVCAGMK